MIRIIGSFAHPIFESASEAVNGDILAAHELLEALPRDVNNPHVFIGQRPGSPLSHSALRKLLQQMGRKGYHRSRLLEEITTPIGSFYFIRDHVPEGSL